MGEPLRPFFSYFGSKWMLAKSKYPAPIHDTIIEPFAGSACYSLHHYDKNVILYDLDPVICGVWDYLIKASPAEILRLPLLEPGEDVQSLDVCQEAQWLIGFWVNSGGATPRRMMTPRMKTCLERGWSCVWGEPCRARIANQVESIKHWRIINASYTNIPQSQPATWFIDPPYRGPGKNYKFSSSGIDYDHLAKWCRATNGQTIVCEQFPADWLPFEALANIKTGNRNERSKEVWWYRID